LQREFGAFRREFGDKVKGGDGAAGGAVVV